MRARQVGSGPEYLGVVREARGVERSELERVREIALALPGVSERLSHGATCFFVGARPLCYFHDHHNDERVALWCPAPTGAQATLTATDPSRYFKPTPSANGTFSDWVGVHLDAIGVAAEWDAIADIVEDAYRLVAPARLVAELGP